MRLSRRGLLLGLGGVAALGAAGGAGFELVEHEVVPGKGRLDEALGRCDAAPPPTVAGPPPTVTGTFRSGRRRRDVGYALVYPHGHERGERLPVCLALHGFGSDAAAAVSTANYGALAGGFVVAAADGGGGYWHPHADDDPLGMLVEDFLPFLGGLGLDTERVGVAGWSMGGYGALLCGLTYRDRFRIVVASSPAIFRDYADAERVNPGAYDSADEWDRYDVTARAREFAGLPVRIEIGAADPFAPAVWRLRERLPDPSVVSVSTGCHDGRFWNSVGPAQVRAIAGALA